MGNDKPKEHFAGIGINIPHSMIEDTIRAEMISAMPNPEIWVAQIVKRALETPGKDRYGGVSRDETMFQQACKEMILSEAKECFAEWLRQHRDSIRKALELEMTRTKGKRIKDLAKRMADGVCTGYISSVNVHIEDDDE